MPPEGYPAPRDLEAQPRFLFWSAESVVIASALTVIGGVLEHPLAGGVAGVLLACLWSRLAAGRANGYALHLAYWHLDGFRMRRTPPSAVRRLIG